MLESLILLLYRHPNFFRGLGGALFRMGGVGLISGALARVGEIAPSIGTRMAGQPPVADIAQLLPGVWTWWIPETFAGLAVYFALCSGGAWLALAAKDAQRCLRAA